MVTKYPARLSEKPWSTTSGGCSGENAHLAARHRGPSAPAAGPGPSRTPADAVPRRRGRARWRAPAAATAATAARPTARCRSRSATGPTASCEVVMKVSRFITSTTLSDVIAGRPARRGDRRVHRAERLQQVGHQDGVPRDHAVHGRAARRLPDAHHQPGVGREVGRVGGGDEVGGGAEVAVEPHDVGGRGDRRHPGDRRRGPQLLEPDPVPVDVEQPVGARVPAGASGVGEVLHHDQVAARTVGAQEPRQQLGRGGGLRRRWTPAPRSASAPGPPRTRPVPSVRPCPPPRGSPWAEASRSAAARTPGAAGRSRPRRSSRRCRSRAAAPRPSPPLRAGGGQLQAGVGRVRGGLGERLDRVRVVAHDGQRPGQPRGGVVQEAIGPAGHRRTPRRRPPARRSDPPPPGGRRRG